MGGFDGLSVVDEKTSGLKLLRKKNRLSLAYMNFQTRILGNRCLDFEPLGCRSHKLTDGIGRSCSRKFALDRRRDKHITKEARKNLDSVN